MLIKASLCNKSSYSDQTTFFHVAVARFWFWSKLVWKFFPDCGRKVHRIGLKSLECLMQPGYDWTLQWSCSVHHQMLRYLSYLLYIGQATAYCEYLHAWHCCRYWIIIANYKTNLYYDLNLIKSLQAIASYPPLFFVTCLQSLVYKNSFTNLCWPWLAVCT